MTETIRRMTAEIADVLDGRIHGVWLYGSVVFDDFRLGWSDIDLVVFADGAIGEAQAERLVTLRQNLAGQYPENPYFRCFEGIIASWEEYRANAWTRLVYWGTTGQRVTDRCELDPFARFELARYGRQVCGAAEPNAFAEPDREELIGAVRRHCDAIRRYAVQTDESLYSCGWLLDTARCVYTLRYYDVIAKTRAGVWALENHIFPDGDALKRTLEIRRDPLFYRGRADTKQWLRSLGPTVQRFADVLERELAAASHNSIQ